MSTSPAASARVAPSPQPTLLLVQSGEERNLRLESTPFTIGRKSGKDLVIPDPRVSRDHAEIVVEGGDFYLVDSGSKHGTYVNGRRVQRHLLAPDDCIEFGAIGVAQLYFSPTLPHGSSAREFLSQISSGFGIRGGASDLEKLTLFLEAARKLNTTGVLDEILITLIEATLRLTGAERGYVFLRDKEGELRLAAGRNSKGEPLTDDRNLSRSILEEAAHAASEFLVTDTTKSSDLASRQSIVAYDLRTVICIPLRRMLVHSAVGGERDKSERDVTGVLYLDSRFASGDISTVSHDLLRAIATEAAALVENARLVQAEQAARRYQQELSIAASIQQRLMAVRIPEVPYARVHATSIPCVEVGGDFYDVVVTREGLTVVLADVCGKGISAALLASILQGMVYSQLLAGVPLAEVVAVANRFLCQKDLGSKYATVFMARVSPDGELEYVNCGHVPPFLVPAGDEGERLTEANLPIGLLSEATYTSARRRLSRHDRLLVVSDGITEAENMDGDFFGDDRLERAARSFSADEVLGTVRAFTGDHPFTDDCTLVELVYCG